MRHQGVDLDPGAGIEQQVDPLARRHLAARMLPVDPLGTTAQLGLLDPPFQLLDLLAPDVAGGLVWFRCRGHPSGFHTTGAQGEPHVPPAAGSARSTPRIQAMRSNANGAEQRPLLTSDVAAPADALTRLVARGDQEFEAFFERVESVELLPKGAPNRVRLRKEQGLAVRKIENGRSRLAAADTISGPAFAACCDRVAGTTRSIGTTPPRIRTGRWPALRVAQIEQAESRLTRAVNRRRVGFPMEITARRHRRQVQVIRSRMAAPPQFEEYFSLHVKTPWGVWGGLLPSLAAEDLDPVALCLVDRLRSRGLPPHRPGPGVIVLGPNAAAVLLHEVVAHALEADTLALSGSPDQVVGLKLGGPELDVVARLEVERGRSAPPPDFDVVLLGRTHRDRRVRQVRHLEQHRVEPLPDRVELRLGCREPLSEARDVREQRLRVFAPCLRLADLPRTHVAFVAQRLHPRLVLPAVRFETSNRVHVEVEEAACEGGRVRERLRRVFASGDGRLVENAEFHGLSAVAS